MNMNKFLLALLLLSPISYAEGVSQYICTIKGIYTNNDGLLIPRDEEKGIGEKLYINTDTAEVTGYFGTDDWAITKYKRPKGLMSIETASGLIGDGVNILTVSRVSKSDNKYTFFYTKNLYNFVV